MPKTILAVDDDPFILMVVKQFLVQKGFNVITMTDPEKAFFWAIKEKPDLVISDVAMPGVDGFTLIRNLKESKEMGQVPLVMLTATDKVSDVEKAQMNIVRVARRLEEEGKIVIGGKGGEELIG